MFFAAASSPARTSCMTFIPPLTIRRAQMEHEGSPLAVWLGILLDGIPESIVIGAGHFAVVAAHPAVDTLTFAQVIPYTLIAGLFLSNFPEALSSSANMLAAKWSRRQIFLMWFAPLVMTAVGRGLASCLPACSTKPGWCSPRVWPRAPC
jgi:hypothetical protein